LSISYIKWFWPSIFSQCAEGGKSYSKDCVPARGACTFAIIAGAPAKGACTFAIIVGAPARGAHLIAIMLS